ncbi:hydrogenase maturation protease [Gammaproteobacteria bacterium]
MSKILILAIGNILLSDDGIGIHILRALQNQVESWDDVSLMDGGTLSFTLAASIEKTAALIVVDAARLEAEPGTVQIFCGEEMDRFLAKSRKSSAHEVNLMDLMLIAQLEGYWPDYRALVAIQPEKMEWGEFPTHRVALAIPVACQRIREIIENWRRKSLD